MGGQISRALADRNAQFLLRLREPFYFHQRLAEKRMEAWLEIEQAERFSCGGDALLETPSLEVNACQLRLHEWVFRIQFKHPLKHSAGSLKIAQFGKRACNTLAETIADRLCLSELFEVLARVRRAVFQQRLAD